jgi:hypothetical protein
MRHIWRRTEISTGSWWGNLEERVNLENLGVELEVILKLIFKKCVERAWNGLI